MNRGKGVALVLAGGGGKGAYQIGVWKALKEYGVDKYITAVAGTSVGALNAALFAHGDLQTAENIYLNISHDQILSKNYSKHLSLLLKHIGNLVSISLFSETIKSGVFSRDGLVNIINKHINTDLIANSKIECIATCHNIFRWKSEYLSLNNQSSESIVKILLASSALPGIFEPVNINGKSYWDGGILDNIPVKPLFDCNYRNFIVIHLDRKSYIDEKLYPNSRFIQIVPIDHQGDFIDGTLDFSKEGSTRRMKQGYQNAKLILEPLYEMSKVQNGFDILFDKLLITENIYKDELKNSLSEINELKNSLKNHLNY